MSSDSVSFLGGGILVVVMVKAYGFGQYRYTKIWGHNFLDFYFLNFTDFFWRCVTSGNDAISISLDFEGSVLASQIFTFCRDFLLNTDLTNFLT